MADARWAYLGGRPSIGAGEFGSITMSDELHGNPAAASLDAVQPSDHNRYSKLRLLKQECSWGRVICPDPDGIFGCQAAFFKISGIPSCPSIDLLLRYRLACFVFAAIEFRSEQESSHDVKETCILAT